LPVGVGGEAGSRVEREIRTHRAEVLRIERQDSLQAENAIGEQAADKTEHQEGKGVLLPGLLLLRLNAEEPVEQPFEGAEERVEKRLSLSVQHPKDVKPHGFCQPEKQGHKQHQLKPSVDCHLMHPSLRIFRVEECWPRGRESRPARLNPRECPS
jgi:hypothetical protein